MLALGTTGRGAELTLLQRMKALEQLVRAAGDGNRIIAAISANPAEDVRLLLEHAASVGVKGVAVTPPFYGTWTNAELLDWVEAALGTGPRGVEVYLYHIPPAVRNGWEPEILTQVDQRIGIAGIKDSSGDVHQLIKYLAWGRERTFSVMVGNERLTTYCFMLGGSGIVSGLSTAYPELLLQAYAACQHKDWDTAAALQRDINEKLDQFTHVSARRTGDVLLELAREHGVL
jgi:dihydrodipicolinate synthase/N-acetylneuraminate lyase